MNQYTELLRYIKQIGESDELVNTIARGTLNEIDLDKQNIYPLLHINIESGSFSNGQTLLFNVEIACMDIRDENNEVLIDKFWDNDNEVDNHNVTLAILNRLWTRMYRDFDDKKISVTENPPLQKITHEKFNLLDGWVVSFEVEVPNTDLNLCS